MTTIFALALLALAQDPAELAPNRADEPLAKEFSLDRARGFLDAASREWQKGRKCVTCHTNAAYLSAGAETGVTSEAFREVRSFTEELVRERWASKGPRWDAEVVVAAYALATSDGEKLHPLTRQALDRMWAVQRPDGGWSWLKCAWPPMESDDHYGATLAILAAGRAPEKYAETPAAKEGVAKALGWLAKNPPATLHQRAMLLWASKYVEGVMGPEDRKKTLVDLLAVQRPDGGWASPSLGPWKRGDGKEQDLESSDGYGTGFVTYLARLSGVPADDARLRKGIDWLKTHQRESGRWYTRSPNKDSKHFLSHAGTAFALLALHACEGR
jgi:squalene-hopene/tetraprenyl-beta-curcumene cyclase